MEEKNRDYTKKQLSDAMTLITLLGKIPEEKRGTVVLATNAFISGMEAAGGLKELQNER